MLIVYQIPSLAIAAIFTWAGRAEFGWNGSDTSRSNETGYIQCKELFIHMYSTGEGE